MKVVGVTGTKGKTTTTYILDEILRAAGASTGLIGTIEYRRPGWRMDAPRTTPESSDLQALLRDFLDAGASHCVMEVSSHALEQKRVWGVSYDVAVFTNLSGEHLDYHREHGGLLRGQEEALLPEPQEERRPSSTGTTPGARSSIAELPMTTIAFGLEPEAIVRALKYGSPTGGMDTQLSYPGGIIADPVPPRRPAQPLQHPGRGRLRPGPERRPRGNRPGHRRPEGVPGRFERVENGRGLQIVVDYAHTDNALENPPGDGQGPKARRLILVFGAGGNRDRRKRERMGDVAARMADWTVITSDNPRQEDPAGIIADIEKGFARNEPGTTKSMPDRKEAIRRALAPAGRATIILVAGKGHEDYQIFKDGTIHFSDVEVIARILDGMKAIDRGRVPTGRDGPADGRAGPAGLPLARSSPIHDRFPASRGPATFSSPSSEPATATSSSPGPKAERPGPSFPRPSPPPERTSP